MREFDPETLTNPRSPLVLPLLSTLVGYLSAAASPFWAEGIYGLLAAWAICSIGCIIWLKSPMARSILFCALVWVAATLRFEHSPIGEHTGDFPQNTPPRAVTVEVTVEQVFELKPGASHVRGIAKIESIDSTLDTLKGDKFLFSIEAESSPKPIDLEGFRWRMEGVLASVEPGSFSEFLARKGIHKRLNVVEPIVHSPVGGIADGLAHIRYMWTTRILEKFADEPDIGAVLIALSLGDDRSLSEDAQWDFFATGTLHVFAISGMHILAIFGMLFSIQKFLKFPKRIRIFLAITLTGMFILLTGAPPSAIRAFAILLIFYSAKAVNRRCGSFASVVFSATVYLWIEPAALYQLGFALSFSVVSAILLMGLPLSRQADAWFEAHEAPQPNKVQRFYRRKIKRGFTTSICISFAAFMASAPWILASYGSVTPFGIFANAMVVVVAMTTLFLLLCISPFVMLFESSSFLLELPAMSARIALFMTESWASWPIIIQTNAIENTYNLPLISVLASFIYLYVRRVRLQEVKIPQVCISCIPILIYGITYPWQLAHLG